MQNWKDEYSWECSPEIAPKILHMSEEAMVKAGEFHHLNMPLKGEGKIGLNWKEIH